MKKKFRLWLLGALATDALGVTASVQAQQASMTFFVTSVGKGNGADLGGLEGADAHCMAVARAAGSTQTNWRAYLSTTMPGGDAGINARDRIGKGPWQNAKGVVIAKSVEDLHGASNNLNKQTALTEKGAAVNGRGDQPNTHDILTGSQTDGTAFTGADDRTCGNWTKSGADGAAMLGHHDRMGLNEEPPAKSWNTSHPSRGGCSQDALKGTGCAGLFACCPANSRLAVPRISAPPWRMRGRDFILPATPEVLDGRDISRSPAVACGNMQRAGNNFPRPVFCAGHSRRISQTWAGADLWEESRMASQHSHPRAARSWSSRMTS